MKLEPTPALTMALQAASDGAFVCHPAYSHHVPGWGWAGGGDVSMPVQDSLTCLHRERLIEVNTLGRWHVDGDPVYLTTEGSLRLAEWRELATRQVLS